MKSVMVRYGLSVVAYPIGGTPYDVGVGHLAELYVVREMHVHESILLRRWGPSGRAVLLSVDGCASSRRSCVLTHAYGLPTTIEALHFMLGAVLAFAFVGSAAFGGMGTRFAHAPREAALWGSFHFLSVGSAIGAAALVSYLVAGGAGWVLGPFASTTIYLLVLGAQFSAADRRSPEDRD
jgi:hypothetical protein